LQKLPNVEKSVAPVLPVMTVVEHSQSIPVCFESVCRRHAVAHFMRERLGFLFTIPLQDRAVFSFFVVVFGQVSS